MKLEDLEIYKLAMEIGEMVWKIVAEWEYLHKKHPGSQFTEAADSIAANIAESHGRFFYKVKKQFIYFARGSLLETKIWAVKSHNRNLMNDQSYHNLIEKLRILHYKLNTWLKTLKSK